MMDCIELMENKPFPSTLLLVTMFLTMESKLKGTSSKTGTERSCQPGVDGAGVEFGILYSDHKAGVLQTPLTPIPRDQFLMWTSVLEKQHTPISL